MRLKTLLLGAGLGGLGVMLVQAWAIRDVRQRHRSVVGDLEALRRVDAGILHTYFQVGCDLDVNLRALAHRQRQDGDARFGEALDGWLDGMPGGLSGLARCAVPSTWLLHAEQVEAVFIHHFQHPPAAYQHAPAACAALLGAYLGGLASLLGGHPSGADLARMAEGARAQVEGRHRRLTGGAGA